METAPEVLSISYFWAAILGLVQGVTEFLPVSSSGHLALVEHLGMGVAAPPAFDVFLHLATLLVVVVYFRSSIAWYFRNDPKVLAYVVVATVPTAVIGLAGKRYFEALRHSPTMICVGLLVTASALSVAEIRRVAGYQLRDLGWFGAFTVGLCQSLALTPGISRSGLTIAGAMLAGVDRAEAFRFSFIIAIPAVLGAVVVHGWQMYRAAGWGGFAAGLPVGPSLVAFVLAAASGFAALWVLERMVSGGRLVWFAGYCCLVAIAGLVYFNVFA